MPRIKIESPSFAFALIVNELRNQYTLAYYPTSDKCAGARAKATALLKMKRLKKKARIRSLEIRARRNARRSNRLTWFKGPLAKVVRDRTSGLTTVAQTRHFALRRLRSRFLLAP